ncbi:hypothetical protein P43SY_010873 [Pythium insidiosum]|uniref:Apple domain-containing protein n=1 Tax=Pythium insidiosum TaxID=114742 RepID=A0AAD5Q1P7_PYTIN|nr:hypothetical protein P43SY_010873 [Pythium insidiosum]
MYQCRAYDRRCGHVKAGVAFQGTRSIFNGWGSRPPQACCNQCHEALDCVAFTVLVDRWGRGNNSCTLWSRVDSETANRVAISSAIDREASSDRSCGDKETGVTCCPGGSYCQPRNQSYYECMPRPSKCSRLLVNVNLDGQDLKALDDIDAAECCERCIKEPNCRGFTIDYSLASRSSVCRLKGSITAQEPHPTAVSGFINERYL